ncbi:hypothetical protein M422DRAFT_248598 [Sphaerobolus stellatus SS14]|nr:hypothetical protein M422DRAFT_248598 [Sphaerobolus stellatus SS14]
MTGLVFEVSILTVTLQHTFHQWWSTRRTKSSIASGHFLIKTIFEQGVIRFLLISVWTLEGAINFKTVRMTFTGIDAGLEYAPRPELEDHLKDYHQLNQSGSLGGWNRVFVKKWGIQGSSKILDVKTLSSTVREPPEAEDACAMDHAQPELGSGRQTSDWSTPYPVPI